MTNNHREIYWFQDDLRLQDNAGLAASAAGAGLLCVYFHPRNRPWCQQTGVGKHRERFRLETLRALDASLRERGQRLLVLDGDPVSSLPALAEHHGATAVRTTCPPGIDEQRQCMRLRDTLGERLVVHSDRQLFGFDELPFAEEDLPRQYTPFRRATEPLPVPAPTPAPDRLPPPPRSLSPGAIPEPGCRPHPAFPLRGGSGEGQRRLRSWLQDQRRIVNYQATRNDLDGLDGSSVLSPWLANGSLSVREVAAAITEFEATDTCNESTRHLFSELLWREFFHWRCRVDGDRLFAPFGIARKKKLQTFDGRDFARWCQGETDYPIVNALMHQLVATGWMSNRGRQIAASCLVNELNHDWRYGAAFFEKHLVDFDVASNYGNWQYIAGVGTDPRGGRHFNLDKQTALYDPDGHFIAKWDGQRATQPRYVTDASDWPIGAPD